MGLFRPRYTQVTDKGYGFNSLSDGEFNEFSVAMLGLGDVSKESKAINALAAIFDLEGFTNFCNQLEPHLVVPEYLSAFLPWLFSDVAKQFVREKKDGRTQIWGSLPFSAKYTGDGVLFLWDIDMSKGAKGIGNIALSLLEVCMNYKRSFLKTISAAHAKTPPQLRVGICRGLVLPIGNGTDFVGPAINMAARLQKIGPLSSAISRRGFDPTKCFNDDVQGDFLVKKISIRGIGDDEPIVILKNEFAALAEADKSLFK